MEPFIPLVTKNCVKRIFLDDIIYIMKKQRKIRIITQTEAYEYYEKLEHIEGMLDKRFYACLQHFVINMDYVERMENQTVYFQNGDCLPMGRDNYIKTRQYYSAYLKKLL